MARGKTQSNAARHLTELLDRGDFRSARTEALNLATHADLPEVDREAVEEALARTRPERMAVTVGVIGAAVFAAALFYGLIHHSWQV